AQGQFRAPARAGRLAGRAPSVRRGRDVAFLAGELLDDSGQVVAVAVATAQMRALPSRDGPSGPGPVGGLPAVAVIASQVCMLPSLTPRARTAGRAARPTSSAGTLRPVRRPRRAGRPD